MRRRGLPPYTPCRPAARAPARESKTASRRGPDAGHVRPLSRRGGGDAARRRRPAPRRRLRRLQGGRAGPGRVLLLAPGARSPQPPQHRPPHAPAPDGRGVPQHAHAAPPRRLPGSATPPSPTSPGTPRTCASTRSAHPWVLYWTGDITDGADPAAKTEAFRRHGVLEASIDVILTRERSDDTAWLRRQRLLRLPSAQATTAARLLSGMLSDVYDVTLHPHGSDARPSAPWSGSTRR